MLLSPKVWFAVYDGEGGAQAGATGAQAGATSAQAGATGAQAGGTEDRKFTQADVNKFLAEDKRKHQEKIQQTVTQLEELQKQKGLSEQAQKELQQRIEDLNNSLLSKEEQTKREFEKRDKEYKEALGKTSEERDFWKGNYSTEVTKNQIIQSVINNDGLRPEQFLELLGPKTRLVPILDQDGKTVKGYAPKVRFLDQNDKNEAVELDLSIEEAVKRMKELPERFGNLFKSGTSGGIGGTGSTGTVGAGTLKEAMKSPEAWRQQRTKLGLGRRK